MYIDIKKPVIKNKRFSLSVPDKIYTGLKLEATRYDISVNECINQVLSGYLKSKFAKGKQQQDSSKTRRVKNGRSSRSKI